ncbi:MAG: ABC transporter ATP-binding protein [Candidatus Helarchaeota archaeon]
MPTIKLSVQNLSKWFDTNGNPLEVLRSISFDVYQEEFVSVVGPSGCGKTTLLRIIAGLEPPSNGAIRLEEELVTKPSRRIGYVPQQFSLFPWRTVRKNIAFGLELKGIKKPERNIKIDELLKMTGLKPFENFYPKDISGGMKQKVAIARALAIDQEILLLDEPLISIDAQNRNKLQDDLLEIWQKTKRTIIFVSHNIDEAVYLSDRIIILSPLPASVQQIISIDLPRPRNRTSFEFNQIREKILTILALYNRKNK